MNAKLKRGCGILLIVSVVLLSILALLPDADVDHDAGYTASELSIRETVDGSMTSTSYVNPTGFITDAIDMGYATVCRMRDDNGRVVEECYLDASGNPVARYGNHYGVSYEYDETSTVITYLDAEGNPIILSDGYSIIVRTQVGGRDSDDFYYDLNGQQVQCSGGYYGLHRGYNSDGQNISLTFFDKDGHAVSTSSGYAIKTYQRDGNGTVVGEQYFDTEGNPARSSLGQYGELYQRNEQGYIDQITYLDADSNPAPTNAGYTILKRTYHRDGTADTDMYFDANGNPKALSKGQYGIKRSGDVNLLLDKNGNIMLCVDNLLNGFPCMVVVFGCVVCLLMIVLPKSLSVVLTIVYVAFILYETLMFRESGDARMNFVLFSYAGKFLKEQSVRVGVINNIWLFIPLGTGLYRWFQKKWALLVPFVMSVAIETTQYVTGLGIAELDDVFGNTMGGWIGIVTASTAANVRKTSMEYIRKILRDRVIPFFKNKIKHIWYFILVVASTVYLFCNHFAIDKINDASLISTVFIVWAILLVLPLFTELELFGVKVKKEVEEAVEKSNKEVKDSLNNLQQLVMQIQVSNNATNQLTINGNPLPSESRIEELTNAIQTLTAQKNNEKTNEVPREEGTASEQNVELFKIRYDIEMALRECIELLRFEPQTRMTTISMARILNQRGLLDSTTTDTLIEIVRIANRAVHGEMLNQKYVGFVRKTYPGILDELQKCKNRINMA